MIVYTVICRAKDAAILVEVATSALTGNAPQVTTALLEHLRDHPAALVAGDCKTFIQRNDDDGNSSKSSNGTSNDFPFAFPFQPQHVLNSFFSVCGGQSTMMFQSTEDDTMELGTIQEHYFHLWHQDGIFYCCLSDDRQVRNQKVNFAYLQALSKEFETMYTKRRRTSCNAYAMNESFQRTVKKTMHYYNLHHDELAREAHVAKLLTQVADMKQTLGRNVHLLLERDEKLEHLLEQSTTLQQESQVFKKRSTTLKSEQQLKYRKYYGVLCGFILLFVYGVLVGNCGIRFQKCKAQPQ